MKLPSPPRGEEPDNVLPLINIVFLLLIFFMLAGALHAVDYFNVKPPNSASQTPASLDDTIILVSAKGQIAYEGREIDEIDLQLAMSDRLVELPNTVIRLKADAKVDAARVVEIMEMLEAVGVRQLTLLTLDLDS